MALFGEKANDADDFILNHQGTAEVGDQTMPFDEFALSRARIVSDILDGDGPSALDDSPGKPGTQPRRRPLPVGSVQMRRREAIKLVGLLVEQAQRDRI